MIETYSTFLHLTAIAFGLSADSFAVALSEGVMLKDTKYVHSIRVAVVFGICQGTMPIVGWALGYAVYDFISPFSDPAAFAILSLVGGRMIYNSLKKTGRPASRTAASRGMKLWLLGLAVSLDALGMGVTIAIIGIQIWTAALVIGVITAATCVPAVLLGKKFGVKTSGRAELCGGILLVAIGFMLLL